MLSHIWLKKSIGSTAMRKNTTEPSFAENFQCLVETMAIVPVSAYFLRYPAVTPSGLFDTLW